MFSEEKVNVL